MCVLWFRWLQCARKVSVWVRVVRHGVLEVTPCSGVFVCSPGFRCKWVWCVVVSTFCGSESRVCHGVWVCDILWVQSGFVCLRVSAGFCWLFKCESRVVKGVWIWRDKKRARNQPQKGREAEVTSTVSLPPASLLNRSNPPRVLSKHCQTHPSPFQAGQTVKLSQTHPNLPQTHLLFLVPSKTWSNPLQTHVHNPVAGDALPKSSSVAHGNSNPGLQHT